MSLATIVLWVSLLIAVIALSVSIYAMRLLKGAQRRLPRLLSADQSRRAPERQSASAGTAPLTVADAPWKGDVTALRERVEDLERVTEQLREDARRSREREASQDAAGADATRRSGRHLARVVSDTDLSNRPSESPPTDLEIVPGALSNESAVRFSNSSKPMVEIRWRPGQVTAEVWLRRDYKFAEVTADYLRSAFDLDGGGPGSYETVRPAVVTWGPGMTVGQLTVRGRARPLEG